MTDHLPPELVQEVDQILERTWAAEMAVRQASEQRLRKAQETMDSTQQLLAEMQDAESDRLADELATWDRFWGDLWGDDPPEVGGDGC
ncbi:MAG TPA: hypothetical protein VFO65_06125 [Acidimicrobiales bacterium]|nr:hypothetical protein [Acidimicrobiales bacterium]